MARFFLFLSYNGEKFNGWQSQKNAVSLQESIEKCLSLILREDIKLTGAGRTDTGVHASFYTAHFDSKNLIAEEFKNFLHKTNNFLPDDIYISDIKQVSNNANARYDALSRTYEYHITGTKNPFKNNFQFQIALTSFNSISLDLMNEACQKLLLYTDFSSFSKSGTQTKTNECKIMEAFCISKDYEIIFHIKANRFLRNMVRAIAGTLLEVGLKKITINDFCSIIESKNRCKAGMSVPAKGLFLVNIEYPDYIYIKNKDME
ncbi:MAG: tRNA pseudouridine(38-40) synthase TruA [Bacteroidales bacterium]|nr:tRNA pseudouridine(38-40) synthase TruA [Bacteroidales bacterium]